jgi:adenylate cyclase
LNSSGVASHVFTSGKGVIIDDAYADERFQKEIDLQTGYKTKSILCVPVVNKNGKKIGVTQVLNKRGGAFTSEDEARLKAFTSQISIGLENAKLFDDVENIKNYNESILESMSSGVITLSPDGVIGDGVNLSKMYIERCEYLQKSPPGPGWTGVWVMDSK